MPIEPFLTQTDIDPQLEPILAALTQAQQIAEHATKVSGAAIEEVARLGDENKRLRSAILELQAVVTATTDIHFAAIASVVATEAQP